MYQYKATIIKVIDGDTVDVVMDLGLDVHIKTRIRLAYIDAPEMNTDAGKAARLRLIELLPPGAEVIVTTKKDRREKYGRYLGDIYDPEKLWYISTRMFEEGHARMYPLGIQPNTPTQPGVRTLYDPRERP